MKKTLALLLTFILISSFILNGTALVSNQDDQLYSLTLGDGTEVFYYLDEEGNPYSYVNGEICYMLLPLESCRITDVQTINELNCAIGNASNKSDSVTFSAPTSYFDMSGTVSPTKSITYETFVNFDLMSKVVTPPIKMNSVFGNLNIVTNNMEKTLLSGKKVTVKMEFYDRYNDDWYEETYTFDFTGEGKNFPVYPSVYPYIRFTITKSSSGVKNFDFEALTWGT